MKALDLFCGGGGSSMGIYYAGFPAKDIIGVDVAYQVDYPFTFIQGNALELNVHFLRKFDFIWASPPCQRFSRALASPEKKELHPDLVTPTVELLEWANIPYCIENVELAPLRKDLILCGRMFGLNLIRHRVFRIKGFEVRQPFHPNKRCFLKPTDYTVASHWHDSRLRFMDKLEAMGIDWITDQRTLANALPPEYSQWVASQFLGEEMLI